MPVVWRGMLKCCTYEAYLQKIWVDSQKVSNINGPESSFQLCRWSLVEGSRVRRVWFAPEILGGMVWLDVVILRLNIS